MAATDQRYRPILLALSLGLWTSCAAPALAPPPVDVSCVAPSANSPSRPAETELVRRIVELTNIERRSAGLDPFVLQCDDVLQRVAVSHSRNMATTNTFGHRDSNGRRPLDRVLEVDPDFRGLVAENLAVFSASSSRGVPSGPRLLIGRDVNDLAREFVENWMKSSGHRANILHPRLRLIGVGVVVKSNSVYVTQLFAGPSA